MEQFSYYMIRIRHDSPGDHPAEQLAGVVERLATGEKRSFADCDELLRLLSAGTNGPPNMSAVTGGGKA
jgi:hypothetical protein